MLRNIPPILSPALLKALREMGHGDTLVLADRNFPSESIGRNSIVIRYDGFGIPELLDAILTLFPVDTYVPKPISFMQVVPGDPVETPIWEEYTAIIKRRGEAPEALLDPVEEVERFAFYEKAAAAYLIIATGETALYGNVILQKGTL